MKRTFDEIMNSLRESIAGFTYYTDFPKVYKNVEAAKPSLLILNSLIGTGDNFDNLFTKMINEQPTVLPAIPLLIATRDTSIKIANDNGQLVAYKFGKKVMLDEEYLLFMKETGLKELIAGGNISNLIDYATGIEAGLDSNARKNRTGTLMENIVHEYFIKEAPNPDDVMVQANKKDIIQKWGYTELNSINVSEDKKEANKRFDFAVKIGDMVYLIETNFYGSGGSKLNETSRSYEKLADDINSLKHYRFVWITDGIGWQSAKNNLRESYEHQFLMATLEDLATNNLIETLKNNQ